MDKLFSSSQSATPMASATPAQAYQKSRELLDLVYNHGFQLAKTAYSRDVFMSDLCAEFPSASKGAGRIAGSDEQNFWVQDGQVVGVWNEEMCVGVTGYSNAVSTRQAVH